jgi:hypothetical protein
LSSRMDRYKQRNTTYTGRTEKNKELYESLYEDSEYSNIEGIASISKSNEIDLDKLKKMLNDKDEKEERKYRTARVPVITKEEAEEIYDKPYDIKSLINKAKNEGNENNEYRSLKKVDLDFLKKLNLKDLRDLKEDPEATEELKDLIDTITSTSVLNKIDDKELSLDMLSELKPTGNTIMDTGGNLKEEIEAKAKEDRIKEIDQTFFTTSHNFKKEDFETPEDKNDTEKENKLKKSLVYVLIGCVIFLVGFVVIKLWR